MSLGVQLFIAWTQRRQAAGQAPLLALVVIESPQDRAAVISMMAMTMLGKAITFMIPLYIQIVQGRNEPADGRRDDSVPAGGPGCGNSRRAGCTAG